MVAPFVDGRVSRSMVRVPGSGTDDDAGPICLNLGIVSNLAAMVPVPQTLNVSSRNGRQQIKFGSCSSVPAKLSDTVPQSVLADGGKPDSALSNGIEVGYSSAANISRPENGGILANQTASGAVPPMSPPNLLIESGNAVLMNSPARKRPLRDGSTGEANTRMMSKRPRIASKSSVVGINGVPQNNQVNGVLLPGTKVNNLKGIPFPVLQAVPFAVPLATGQHQSQSSLGIMTSLSSTGNAIPSHTMPVSASPVTVTREGIKLNGPFILVPVEALPLSLLGGQQNFLEVVQDRNRLQKENIELKYRLARFHQLVRNKEKLISVLNNMNAEVRA